MKTTTKKNIMLVEDHRLFREALAWLLAQEHAIQTVAQTGSLPECRRAAWLEVDVAVVDLDLLSGDGVAVVDWLRDHFPEVPVLALAMDPGLHNLYTWASAEKMLAKTDSADEILAGVRELCERKAPVAMNGRAP